MVKVVARKVSAASAREAVATMRAVPGVIHVRKATDNEDGTYWLVLDLVA